MDSHATRRDAKRRLTSTDASQAVVDAPSAALAELVVYDPYFCKGYPWMPLQLTRTRTRARTRAFCKGCPLMPLRRTAPSSQLKDSAFPSLFPYL